MKLFSTIDKDSAYFSSYQFSKKVSETGVVNYAYSSSEAESFIISCDTTSKYFTLLSDGSDTIRLYNGGERDYAINGRVYGVLKLVADKGVTDGEISYFVSIDFGLLLMKSNTWCMGKVLNPEKENTRRLQMTALLYRVMTDEEFLNDAKPESKIKFTSPKFE
ncbi:hypothetical protein [Filimonas effusa]|uniref:Uncharacterized protein n=1 Tax=Filimonas effusa TaxID=2508721 RepID=A0A4Q1CYV0_9BACT|nr:hypothetical protein [Filimonas effusa]RXK80483.1 hypothetical protein ESB13_23580 [Filimonas effusa]